MAVGFKEFVISFILIGVFVFAFISFGNQFQIDMNANQTILESEDSNLSGLFYSMNRSLAGAETTAGSSRVSVANETFDTIGGEITYKTIPKATINFWDTTTGIFSLVRNFLAPTLGIDAVILTAIGTIFTITLIALGWKFWRTGT